MRDMGWPGDVRSEGGAYRGRGHQSGGGGGGGAAGEPAGQGAEVAGGQPARAAAPARPSRLRSPALFPPLPCWRLHERYPCLHFAAPLPAPCLTGHQHQHRLHIVANHLLPAKP